MSASIELISYGMQMAADRADNPCDDLVTKLVQADVDGTVTQLISKVGIDPQVNADTAALAMLLAA